METRSEQDRIHRLEFDVEWPPGHVACYFIDGPEPILIDTALPDSERTLTDAFSESGLPIADVEHVVITHPHIDHIAGVPELLDAADPTVYAPTGVRKRFLQDPAAVGERVRRNCRKGGFPEERTETAVEMAVESLERNIEFLNPEDVDVWIDHGESIEIDQFSIEALHLPGHQADHLGYIVEVRGEEIFFSGDMAIQPFRPIVLHDGLDDGYQDAFDAFYRALDRMEGLAIDRVYPCHGPIHNELGAVLKRDREALAARLGHVVDLVSDGHDTAASVVHATKGTHDINYIIPEMMGALAYLESTDRLTSERRDGVSYYRNTDST